MGNRGADQQARERSYAADEARAHDSPAQAPGSIIHSASAMGPVRERDTPSDSSHKAADDRAGLCVRVTRSDGVGLPRSGRRS